MNKYTKQVLQEAANASYSYAGMLRYLKVKQSGGMHAHIRKMSTKLGVNTSHFTGQGWSKKLRSLNRLAAKDILVYDKYNGRKTSAEHLRRALIESGIEHKCSLCPVSNEWQGKKLVLQVDHIDGDWLNNKVENLRFLCPNCHSQTETFGVKNTAR